MGYHIWVHISQHVTSRHISICNIAANVKTTFVLQRSAQKGEFLEKAETVKHYKTLIFPEDKHMQTNGYAD